MNKIYIIVLVSCFSINLYSQSVTLTRQNNTEVIEFFGTTKVSPQMAEAVSQNIKQTNEPNTFQKSIICDFVFDNTYNGGRGKIWNITDDLIRMEVTCNDCENIKENPLIIEVKPRTFSRIIFERFDVNKNLIIGYIKCELVR